MQITKAARRYSSALLQLAREKDAVEEVLARLLDDVLEARAVVPAVIVVTQRRDVRLEVVVVGSVGAVLVDALRTQVSEKSNC